MSPALAVGLTVGALVAAITVWALIDLTRHDVAYVQKLWERGIGDAEFVLGYGTDELQRRWRAWVEERWEPATEAQFESTIGSEVGCPRDSPPAGGG